jgi:hypothetical protein
MTDIFAPWYYALRGLSLQAPEGVRTSSAAVTPPPGFEPPPVLADAENAYLRLAAHVENWPFEGATPPDLYHRLKALPTDRKPAEQSLLPLRPLLEGLDEFLFAPAWQIPIPPDRAWPELTKIRRLGLALLIRHALEGDSQDRDRVLRLAEVMRTSQSTMLHFLVGLSLERAAGGSFDKIEAERRECLRCEISRVVIPQAHLSGPWEPVSWELPPTWLDDLRATRWLLAQHPRPYEPEATVRQITDRRTLFEEGTSDEIRKEADRLAGAWPRAMLSLFPQPATVPLTVIRASRPKLLETENPYGILSVARTLYSVAAMAAGMERLKPR